MTASDAARLLELAARHFARAAAEAPPGRWPRRRPRGAGDEDGDGDGDGDHEAHSRAWDARHAGDTPCEVYALRLQADPGLTRCVAVLDDNPEPLPDEFWASLSSVIAGGNLAATSANSQTQEEEAKDDSDDEDIEFVSESLTPADKPASQSQIALQTWDLSQSQGSLQSQSLSRQSKDAVEPQRSSQESQSRHLMLQETQENSPPSSPIRIDDEGDSGDEHGGNISKKESASGAKSGPQATISPEQLVLENDKSSQTSSAASGGVQDASLMKNAGTASSQASSPLASGTQSADAALAECDASPQIGNSPGANESSARSLEGPASKTLLSSSQANEAVASPSTGETRLADEGKTNLAESKHDSESSLQTANGEDHPDTRTQNGVSTSPGAHIGEIEADPSPQSGVAVFGDFQKTQSTLDGERNSPSEATSDTQPLAEVKNLKRPAPNSDSGREDLEHSATQSAAQSLTSDERRKRQRLDLKDEEEDDKASTTSSGASSTSTVAALRSCAAIDDADGDDRQPSRRLENGEPPPESAAPTYARLDSVSLSADENISGSDQLYALGRWPGMMKRRSFAYKMPPPQKQYRGRAIVLWLQLGGVHGEAPSCARFEDNWALGLALWMHIELAMPIVAIAMLPVSMHTACAHVDAGPRSRLHRDRAAIYVDLRNQLDRWSIPLVGVYCDSSDVTSALASFSRGVNAHIVIVPESYSPPSMLLLRHAARAVPCPLFSVDSDCFLPPRYQGVSSDTDDPACTEHRARLAAKFNNALDELEWAHFLPCLQPVADALRLDTVVRAADGAVFVPKHVFDRWALVEPAELASWIETTGYQPRLSEQSVEDNLAALSRASDEFRRVQLGEILVAHLRQGLVSPLRAARRLRAAQNGLVDRLLFTRELEVLRAFRTYKSIVSKFDLAPPSLGATAAEDADAEGEGERANRGEAALPGDLEDGASSDHTWNTIQTRILTDGILWNEAANVRYWVDRVVGWSDKPELGLYLVLRWAANHVIGGQSADFFMTLTAGAAPEALQRALSLQRNVRAPKVVVPDAKS